MTRSIIWLSDTGDIDDGYLEMFIDVIREINPGHGTFQHVVDEDQIRG